MSRDHVGIGMKSDAEPPTSNGTTDGTTESSAGKNKLPLIIGVAVGVAVVAAIAVVLVVVLSGSSSDDSTSSSSSASSSSVAAVSAISVNAVPPPPPGSRRRFEDIPGLLRSVKTSMRRAYDDANTDYSNHQTKMEVNVPGSDTLSTVNMILCFVRDTGIFANTGSGQYRALVDMGACEQNSGTQSKSVYMVYVESTSQAVSGDATSFTAEVQFYMNSATIPLQASVTFTVTTVENSDSVECPGQQISAESGDATKSCWTGSVRWTESGMMDGYFEGAYDSTESTYKSSLTFWENSITHSETKAMLQKQDLTGTQFVSKVSKTSSGTTDYYCSNGGSTHLRMNKGSTDATACASTSSGGICLSRGSSSSPSLKYPERYTLFDGTTGAAVTQSGTTNLELRYSKNSKTCFAGVKPNGAFMSCGQGNAADADMFDEGSTATDDESLATYTLHHSNAKVESFQVVEYTAAEFFGGYYYVYHHWDSGASQDWTYICTVDGTAYTTLRVIYKRVRSSGVWQDFTSDGSTTVTVSGDLSFSPALKNAAFYTGASKPTSSNEWSFMAYHETWTYDSSTGKIYGAVSQGIVQPGSAGNVDMVCPSVCKWSSGGTCQEFTTCPKQTWSGLTLSTSTGSWGCSGASCTFYAYTSDTAYLYQFNSGDAQLYTYTDNSGSTVSAAAIDARTGVTYASDTGTQWMQTGHYEMYPGTAATDFDTPSEIAAYMKTANAIYYKVGIGKKGGYPGWTFYAKSSGASSFVALTAPLSCKVTMSTSTDATGGSDYDGAQFTLSFYSQHTEGLIWSEVTLGNSNIGTRSLHLPIPQIANGAQCTSDSSTYRIKSDFTIVVLEEASGQCSAWDIMTSAGTLPTTAPAPTNAASTISSSWDSWPLCVIETSLITSNSACTFVAGMTSTNV